MKRCDWLINNYSRCTTPWFHAINPDLVSYFMSFFISSHDDGEEAKANALHATSRFLTHVQNGEYNFVPMGSMGAVCFIQYNVLS